MASTLQKIVVLCIVAAVVLIGGFFWLNNYIYEEKQGPTDYKDATYIIDGIPVTLVDGIAEVGEPAGGASKTVVRYFGNEAKGDISGDDIPDITFLITQETGGSGTFFYLVGAIQTPNNTYNGTHAVLIGDRIAPQTTEIRDGLVLVNYADRVPGEPMTARPSIGKTMRLKLEPSTMQFNVVAQEGATRTYTSERYGLSLSYPSSYQLTEHDAEGSALREHHTITLIRTADLPLPEAGEGPPAITIDIYQNNLDSLTTEEWIRGSAASNFKLGEGRLSSISIGGKEALSYRWSGLYEGTTVALAQPDWIYAFSVTYLEPGADIVQDFVAVRESVQIY